MQRFIPALATAGLMVLGGSAMAQAKLVVSSWVPPNHHVTRTMAGWHDELHRPRTPQVMRGAAANMSRFHNEAWRTEASAQTFVDRARQARVSSDCHDGGLFDRADEIGV